MGLASALNTSLTGLTAAEATIDVVGNNVANAGTVGFKASEAVFATQFLQTQGLGSAPTASRGGTNPRQIGLGTKIAEITPDFTQGTIEISSNASDLAIQGDGFFIVEGSQGEQQYTRNGIFKTNANNELVTVNGQRLLGHSVDDQFEIQRTQLTALTIPLGQAAVAQATQTVTMEGNLSPTGDVASTPEIIQSAILSDGTIEVPPDLATSDITGIAPPATLGSTAAGVDATVPSLTGPPAVTDTDSFDPAGVLAPGNVFYKFVHVDANGNEGMPSATYTATIGGGNNAVTLNDPPAVPGGFTATRIYRSLTGAAGSFELAGPAIGAAATSFFDNGTQTVAGEFLDESASPATAPPSPAQVNYQIAFVDPQGNEGPPSVIPGVVNIAGGAPGTKVTLSNLPDAPAGWTKRVFRSSTVSSGVPGGPYLQVGGDLTATDDVFIDDGTAGSSLDTSSLSVGNYSYYVTFFNSGNGLESRPTALIGPEPITIDGRRIRIENIPQPTVGGEFDQVRIYRNLASNDQSFHLLSTLTGGETVYVDAAADSDISSNSTINLEGPPISFGLRLVDVVRRDGTEYNNVFQEGTLSFTGHKGGSKLGTQELEITSQTTVQELINFMEDSMGIQEVSPDPTNPIPGNPGGRVTADSRLELVGNNGTGNAVQVRLDAFQLETTGGVQTVNLAFGSVQEAVGESAQADFVVFDTLGIPINVRVTAVLESRDSTTTAYRWFAESPQNDPLTGAEIAIGTGLILFDGEGNVFDVTNSSVSVDRENVSSATPLQFDLDFSALSGLSTDDSTLAAARQDGSAAGSLSSFIIGEDGRIVGVFSNGVSRDLGQIRLARFANNAGLEQRGENLFGAGVNSGLPIEGDPGQQGIGSVIGGAVELSNTDVGQNLIDLILASTQYRSNTRVITAAQQLLDELLNLRR